MKHLDFKVCSLGLNPGEGPSSSSTPFLGIERGKGFSELGGEVSEILVDAVKKPLSMVFQDG